MSIFNKVQIIGNLTNDPELKTIPTTGTSVVNFSVATNEYYTDKNGEKKEKTEFHKVVCYGKLAETINKYFTKGQTIGIEGRLETRTWEKDGIKFSKTEIVASNFYFINSTKRKEKSEQVDDMPAYNTIEDYEKAIAGDDPGIQNTDDIPF